MSEGGSPIKLLSIDIENSPHLVWTYNLWGSNLYIPPDMVEKPSQIMCFAAKWIGENVEPEFYSTYHNGYEGMLEAAWNLFHEADGLVYYNGDRFDRPKVQKELLVGGFDPPSPSASIDLYAIIKKHFDFPYKRLDEVAKALGLEGKKGSHKANWRKCLEGDREAWDRMKKYNIQDVVLNEQVFEILKPWISSVPSVAVEKGIDACTCGSTNLTKEGFAFTKTGKYQRYRCNSCGTWSRASSRLTTSGITAEAR